MFAKPPEAAHIDVRNPSILRSHAICAAFEAPITPFDLRLFGPSLGPVMAKLRRQEILVSVGSGSTADTAKQEAPESNLPWTTGLGGGAGLGSLTLFNAMSQPVVLLEDFEPNALEQLVGTIPAEGVANFDEATTTGSA